MARPRLVDLRSLLFAAVCSAFVFAYVAIGARQSSGLGPLYNPTDLLAFYCGSRVASAGADPYRSEPLRTCERAALYESAIPMLANLVVPAPLPGYDFALLNPLGRTTFRNACAVWFLTLLGSIGATAFLLLRMLKLRHTTVLYALIGADAGASVVLGQVVPLVVLAIVACGYALRTGRERLAGAAAVATLIEPHLGLPVVVALALFVPRARLVLAIGAVALCELALVTVGFDRCIEYVTAVLPAQARGEGLEFHRQYGLSALLYVAGVSADLALRIGSLSYVAMLAIGIFVARRAERATGDRAFLAFVPVAVSLIAGAYVHIAQMAAALPLALLILSRSTGRSRVYATVALVCLAVPWQTIFADPTIAALFPTHGYVDPLPSLARVGDGARLAEDPWDAWIATIGNRDHRTPLEALLGKLPTWFGLIACATVAAHIGRAPRASRS